MEYKNINTGMRKIKDITFKSLVGTINRYAERCTDGYVLDNIQTLLEKIYTCNNKKDVHNILALLSKTSIYCCISGDTEFYDIIVFHVQFALSSMFPLNTFSYKMGCTIFDGVTYDCKNLTNSKEEIEIIHIYLKKYENLIEDLYVNDIENNETWEEFMKNNI